MPRNKDIKKVLVIGSGPIIIGQAAEFDYAGTQACQALKEEGIEVLLLNTNPATIMTDANIADQVYFEPINVDTVRRILEKEKPDLLIVNRKLDIDYTDGTELIVEMKKNPDFASVPVMLISNYPEYQQEAVRLGAVYGFGKAEKKKKETLERVSQILNRKETV